MIPVERTRLFIEEEMPSAFGWAARQGVTLLWLPEELQIRATLIQPETERPFFLFATLDQYRVIPPAWTFTDSDWGSNGQRSDFPKPVQTQFGASMFIDFNGKGVICAPFNRLAYQNHAGPHGDWGGLENWMNAAGTHVHAETIGDMLQAIYRDFSVTRKRMNEQ